MPRDYSNLHHYYSYDLGQGLLLLIGFAGSLVATWVRPVKARRCYYLGMYLLLPGYLWFKVTSLSLLWLFCTDRYV